MIYLLCPRSTVGSLNRNPLNNIPRHLLLLPVVELGRPRAAVPGEVLHVIERHALGQQICNPRHAERVRRQPRRQPGILQPPLDHPAHVFRGQRIAGQPLRLALRRAEQWPILILPMDARRVQIGTDMPFQIVTHRGQFGVSSSLLLPLHQVGSRRR